MRLRCQVYQMAFNNNLVNWGHDKRHGTDGTERTLKKRSVVWDECSVVSRNVQSSVLCGTNLKLSFHTHHIFE
jgi:hypothetical protein